jgi:hypothetical protein
MIPSNITYENVLDALHKIDRNGIPPKRKAKKFLDCYINSHAIYSDFSTISISSSISPYKS